MLAERETETETLTDKPARKKDQRESKRNSETEYLGRKIETNKEIKRKIFLNIATKKRT